MNINEFVLSSKERSNDSLICGSYDLIIPLCFMNILSSLLPDICNLVSAKMLSNFAKWYLVPFGMVFSSTIFVELNALYILYFNSWPEHDVI